MIQLHKIKKYFYDVMYVSWHHVLFLVLFHDVRSCFWCCLMMTIYVSWWQSMFQDDNSCFRMTIHAPWLQFMFHDVMFCFRMTIPDIIFCLWCHILPILFVDCPFSLLDQCFTYVPLSPDMILDHMIMPLFMYWWFWQVQPFILTI